MPGIFRPDDPCAQLRLAPEGRLELEEIVSGLPTDVFVADDALGWVYQFWQRDKKDQVNASERKIGGADLGPVTQLFTENYMVRFLLENSLGAWWAARRPNSGLIEQWDYLRLDDDGGPAAGSFEQWPDSVAEVTVMDPCCGSGHFLVEAFSMLWQMRVEEEGLRPEDAQDAVLRDNLFGLELDQRCVQIAMFAIALQAWKAGGGWRELPVPHIACTGIPVKASVDEWKSLGRGDARLENALVRLYVLFRDADTLGSLIDPRREVETSDPTGLQASLEDVDWEEVAPLLARVLIREAIDPATVVLGAHAAGVARAADYLSRNYCLVATNVPYLGVQKMPEFAADFMQRRYPDSFHDLATVFAERCLALAPSGSAALVSPLGWLFLRRFAALRQALLDRVRWDALAPLGKGAFGAITGEVVQSALTILSPRAGLGNVLVVDTTTDHGPEEKSAALKVRVPLLVSQSDLRRSPDALLACGVSPGEPLSAYATSWQGLVTRDTARYIIKFWELPRQERGWEKYLTAPAEAQLYSGRESLLRWQQGNGALVRTAGAHNFNPPNVLGRSGVLIGEGSLRATLYMGEMFNQGGAPVIPNNPADLLPLWAYLSSPEYAERVRRINQKVVVGCGYLIKVPFDIDYWREVANERFPRGLPMPSSNDPTQWLFQGRPEASTEPLQVAVARLLGYRWPDQAESDDLDSLADDDGIVCLPSVLGERAAADRVREVLARALGGTWSPTRTGELLAASGSRKQDLGSWLQDDFFKAHCKLFKNRPFVWHVWDGRRDGFGALVNYHRLDRATLERLTFTYLGDWIERQNAGFRDDAPGAEERLVAAQNLQARLQLILAGESPYDIYVRWKSLAGQPLGWEPDLDDGVRLNLRPFIEAEVLRSRVNVKWGKDRGRDPDGSERHNGLHCTRAEKIAARKGL